MSKKVLIVGVGVSSVDHQHYGEQDIEANPKFKALLNKNYDHIIYFHYQELLDKGAIFGKKFLDPVRLKFKQGKRKEIIRSFETTVKTLQKLGYKVDLIAHSLFCWISSLCKVKLNTVIHCGSPVGWVTPGARFLVRNDIAFFWFSSPPLKCNTFINLYSTNILEPVGSRPNTPDNLKWGYSAKRIIELDTRMTHDFSDYIKYLLSNKDLFKL